MMYVKFGTIVMANNDLAKGGRCLWNTIYIDIMNYLTWQTPPLKGEKNCCCYSLYYVEVIIWWLVKQIHWFTCLTAQVISVYMQVQRTWLHLESIFIGSEDIKRQLPEDTERFNQIDAEFRVRKAVGKPKIQFRLNMHLLTNLLRYVEILLLQHRWNYIKDPCLR